MLDTELLSSIAAQMMTGSHVHLEGKSISVRRTSAQHLRTLTFAMNGREYQAIEQNPEKPSRWGQLARSSHQVVQFKDAETNRFVAVAVDGEVTLYGTPSRSDSKP
jgi:hypothetical protein